ncbi:type I restriction endonuclease subunit R [Microscilla marina]|uniref:Type I restriction enzyme endonuclease subunit n=1 Tax=Microscilla marina ATCC 23134 TaxID=313606 RepID=A1ZTI6_MICM2|nr:HsdR family type I site-specific deoxyribonuclease [Microscilla marina]EAY26247.1 type I restriction-modification system R subunit [Microscilla marina ATCC 23134]
MSEYTNVERPFLDQLSGLGWQIHRPKTRKGIPKSAKESLRNNFDEVVLAERFKESLDLVNCLPNGKPWLTAKQKDELLQGFIQLEQSSSTLHETNKAIFERVQEGDTVAKNEVTQQKNALVQFVDFDHWQNNLFDAVPQFRVNTPHGVNSCIIPDIVLFVNGLPWVVVECKDQDVADPLSDAFDQLRRYANQRQDDVYNAHTIEGEPRLFYYNLFSVLTHGIEAKVGTISGEMEHYAHWKDIFPEKYKTRPIAQYTPNQHTKDPAVHQEVMISGLLNPEVLIDVWQNYTLFFQPNQQLEVKIICRYQQYRAVGKILERLHQQSSPMERSGTVWHTQGSGKSLTMAFLVRKLRNTVALKDFKVVVVTDRVDLESQLSETLAYTKDQVRKVNNRHDLPTALSGNSSDLTMVMIHKFLEEEQKHAQSLQKAMQQTDDVPQFKQFSTVNDSDRILMMVDEAHRTQGGDMGNNLFLAFPNATKLGFTGTPLLTNRHKQTTQQRFGGFIDVYTLKEAVRDGATTDILYIGKTSKDRVDSTKLHQQFEDEFSQRTPKEKAEIERRYGTITAYLESDDRIKKNARDMVAHYIADVLPNGFKAQVVAPSVIAAARYEAQILAAIKERIAEEKARSHPDLELIKKLEFLDACTVVSIGSHNEQGYVKKAYNKAKKLKAEANFKKDFDYHKPATGIAFLCVCDRLLTGFDAPIEQVMYLDKNLREHELLQAIARVNRTRKGKTHGLVVDYFGVTKNLKEALAIYADDDIDSEEWQEFTDYFRDINKEIPILESRFDRFMQFLVEKGGLPDIEDFVYQRLKDKDLELDITEACVEAAENIAFRAEFDVLLKDFLHSLDTLFNVPQAQEYHIPGKRLGYLANRIRQRYKDPTMDLGWAKAKVRKMIDQHLESLGIDTKVAQVSLLSDEFPKELDRNALTPKAKASEMAHAMRRHIKDNLQDDEVLQADFSKKIEDIMTNHAGKWEEIASELSNLRNEMRKGRQANQDLGLSKEGMFYYDLINVGELHQTNDELSDEQKQQLAAVVRRILEILGEYLDIPNLWNKESKVKELRSDIDDYLDLESGVPEVQQAHKKITAAVIQAAKKRNPR